MQSKRNNKIDMIEVRGARSYYFNKRHIIKVCSVETGHVIYIYSVARRRTMNRSLMPLL